MFAGTAKIDITPSYPVWMDGMIRDRRSEGVHDRIYARALILSPDGSAEGACAFVSVEVCGLKTEISDSIRRDASMASGIPAENIIVAATHTHSGPATVGTFTPAESEYITELSDRVIGAIRSAAESMTPASVTRCTGREDTISHYRRLLCDDGSVVMNWEPFAREKLIGPLGEVDPEVGILKVSGTEESDALFCLLFNHAGHPDVMSGDSYLISGDYAGFAMNELEARFGGTALFLNGAQGTMDIDGLKDRDWAGVKRAGTALAASVQRAIGDAGFSSDESVRIKQTRYSIPRRIISSEKLVWAKAVLEKTGGTIRPMADGVGDDYRALLFKRLHDVKDSDIDVEQTCVAVGGCAFITFPGELFTEIGLRLKRLSPFEHTFIIGLANGKIGYLPTKKALTEGGYAVETREVGDDAEEIVVSHSLELLREVYRA